MSRNDREIIGQDLQYSIEMDKCQGTIVILLDKTFSTVSKWTNVKDDREDLQYSIEMAKCQGKIVRYIGQDLQYSIETDKFQGTIMSY